MYVRNIPNMNNIPNTKIVQISTRCVAPKRYITRKAPRMPSGISIVFAQEIIFHRVRAV